MRSGWIGLIAMVPLTGMAQNTKSLETAFARALEHNLQLRAGRYRMEVAQNSDDPGMAGLYPRVSATGQVGLQDNDTRLEFANGQPDVEVEGARSYTYGGGLDVNYTLFDGMGSWHTLRQLQTQARIGELEFAALTQNVLLQTASVYYDMASRQEEVRIARENVEISTDRYRRFELAREYGSGSSFDLSSARVDLSNDSLALIVAQSGLRGARRGLDVLMGGGNEPDFSVETEVVYAWLPPDDSLRSLALSADPALLRAYEAEKAAAYASAAAGSAFWPRLDLNAGYDVSVQDNEVGLLLLNQFNGWNAGVGLRWDVFNGNANRIRDQNAELLQQAAQIEAQAQGLNTRTDLENALDVYHSALEGAAVAERNTKAARLNFTRAQELYRLGQVNQSQFREAQLNLAQSESTVFRAHFSAKLAELEVLRLCGLLMTSSGAR